MRTLFFQIITITVLSSFLLPAFGASAKPTSTQSDTNPTNITNQYTLIRQDTIPTPTGEAYVKYTPDDKYLATKGVNIGV